MIILDKNKVQRTTAKILRVFENLGNQIFLLSNQDYVKYYYLSTEFFTSSLEFFSCSYERLAAFKISNIKVFQLKYLIFYQRQLCS